jgi:hypothetical protein
MNLIVFAMRRPLTVMVAAVALASLVATARMSIDFFPGLKLPPAVERIVAGLPFRMSRGVPLPMLLRIGLQSESSIGALTHSSQSAPRATGPASSNGGPVLRDRFDHGHASARSTRPARSGLLSTYLMTVKRCSSS